MAGVGFSGKDGDIKIGATSINEIRAWTFNPKSTNPRYASNKTAGYKRTVAGIKEGSGTATGAYDTTTTFISVIDVGTSATLLLYIDATHFFSVPSVIDDYKVNVDIDTGEIVGWEASFSTNGAWTNPTAPMILPPGVLGEQAAAPIDPKEIKAGISGVDLQTLKDAGFLTGDQTSEIINAAKQAMRELLEEFVAAGAIHKTPTVTKEETPSELAGELVDVG